MAKISLMKINKDSMYKLNLLISFLFVFISLQTFGGNNFSRRTENFNQTWKYYKGDLANASSPNVDDSEWENIGLPHSFSIPYFLSKDFYVGYGWYRKTFVVEKTELTNKKNFLEFEGVFQEAEVFVNGMLAGTHKGGYTGFSIDISDLLTVGKNLVAIRVNNLWRPDLAPRAGEHTFSGGIYRNVWRVTKSLAYIGWYGTFVTTPNLEQTNGKSSCVDIQTEIHNDSKSATEYRLISDVLNSQGVKVASVTSAQFIDAKAVFTFKQQTKNISDLKLWSPNHPSLYKTVSLLYCGKQLLDRYETSFGFRWCDWTADKGFFLNGEHVSILGANVHQDHAGWGDAVTEAGMKRDIKMVKDAGFNFIRGSHYPHAPSFSNACDELGVLFWSETPFWGIGGYKEDGYWDSSAYPTNEKNRIGFENSLKQQLSEMIRIHRNHPSVIVWSMCNEPFFSSPEVMNNVRGLLGDLVTLSKQLDPTRKAAIGGAQRPLGDQRIDKIGDIAGYNGDGSIIAEFQNPGIPTLVSEYGSITADRPGKYIPCWGDLAKNDAYKGMTWRSGQAIWCAFDHGSIAGSALGKMGIIDYFRIPKRSWYWYRNAYKGIAPPEWPIEGTPAKIKLECDKVDNIKTDGTEDAMLRVTVVDASGKALSNTPPIKLNVLSGPGEFPTGNSISFEKGSDIRILDGQAAIEFRSYYSGKTIIRAISNGLESGEVTLHFVGDIPFHENLKSKERSYKRFVRTENKKALQIFGPNNPTFASSIAFGHSSALAADDNANTCWEAADDDKNPFWLLDTEKGLEICNINIQFGNAEVYKYKVQVSSNKLEWNTIFDYTHNSKVKNNCQLSISPKIYGRFVRILYVKENFTKRPSIAEVKVLGVVVD